ncbi:MAG TPA: hypothetical protein VN223_13270 [Candidatus Elarobacter sp.]|nr:hypothetical protein [Candidatus Elarobacter sp.]
MSRSVFIIPFLAFTLQVAQAQLFSHGAPASVVSPTADGRQHGVPASVVSPTQLPFGVNPQRSVRIHGPLRRFGNPRSSRRQVFVPVPVFYSYYGDSGYPSAADPYVPESSSDPAPAQQASADRSDEDLRAAYLQGAHDAVSRQGDSRYGEHYTDSRERNQQQPAQEDRKSERRSKSTNDSEAQAAPVDDKTPAAVFIFKDGHQLETKNYAIMGGTLFDFSSKMLKKIQMDEIDSAATLKANDDRGVTMKLN